jgi:hypothetical protein
MTISAKFVIIYFWHGKTMFKRKENDELLVHPCLLFNGTKTLKRDDDDLCDHHFAIYKGSHTPKKGE